MKNFGRSSAMVRKPNGTTRLILSTFFGILFGFFIGLSFRTLSLTKLNFPANLLPSVDLSYIDEKNTSRSTQTFLHALATVKNGQNSSSQAQNLNSTSKLNFPLSHIPSVDLSYIDKKNTGCSTQTFLRAWSTIKNSQNCSSQAQNLNSASKMQIWVPSNPRGAERLPPRIVASESDFYLRRLWGKPSEDLTSKPKYLVTFTVGVAQKNNVDAAVKKFSENFTVLLFHYDNRTTEWDEFEWSKRAIHVSARKQSKWWYAKRFLHPDIVASYEYIFIWDEDLGVEHFDAEEYIKLVTKHGLEISQPGLEPNRRVTWQMTKRRDDSEVHKETEEKRGRCSHPHLPPCAAFVEIMAPVFSRDAWRCVWHMIQNDLIHGWGLDFALRRCVETAPEKIGVVDSQWIVHQRVPSLGNEGQAVNGKKPWQGVRDRCINEGKLFQNRLENAEKAYYKDMEIDYPNTSTRGR